MAAPPSKAHPNRLDILTNYLKLSRDQRKRVLTIMDDGQKEAAPMRDQMVKTGAEVAAAGDNSEETNRAVKIYAELQTKMVDIEMKAFAQIYRLLDSAQQQRTEGVFRMMSGIFKGKNWTEIEP